MMAQMTARLTLPQRRRAETFELCHGGQNTPFQITVGYYPDDRVGELFIAGGKSGSDLEAIAREGAIMFSLAIQYGAPLDVVQRAILREQNGEPSTIIGAAIDRLMEEKT